MRGLHDKKKSNREDFERRQDSLLEGWTKPVVKVLRGEAIRLKSKETAHRGKGLNSHPGNRGEKATKTGGVIHTKKSTLLGSGKGNESRG